MGFTCSAPKRICSTIRRTICTSSASLSSPMSHESLSALAACNRGWIVSAPSGQPHSASQHQVPGFKVEFVYKSKVPLPISNFSHNATSALLNGEFFRSAATPLPVWWILHRKVDRGAKIDIAPSSTAAEHLIFHDTQNI